jgi:hypothetical protein
MIVMLSIGVITASLLGVIIEGICYKIEQSKQ